MAPFLPGVCVRLYCDDREACELWIWAGAARLPAAVRWRMAFCDETLLYRSLETGGLALRRS
jgi:hypothetical protein